MNAAQAPTATPDKPGSTQGIACTHLEARCSSGGNRQRKLWCGECNTWVDKFEEPEPDAQPVTAAPAHTPEPWTLNLNTPDGIGALLDADGEGRIASFFACGDEDCAGPQNLRRVVACVNACAGLADPAAELAKLRASNAALVEALETIKRSNEFNGGTFTAELQEIARAALEAAKEARL